MRRSTSTSARATVGTPRPPARRASCMQRRERAHGASRARAGAGAARRARARARLELVSSLARSSDRQSDARARIARARRWHRADAPDDAVAHVVRALRGADTARGARSALERRARGSPAARRRVVAAREQPRERARARARARPRSPPTAPHAARASPPQQDAARRSAPALTTASRCAERARERRARARRRRARALLGGAPTERPAARRHKDCDLEPLASLSAASRPPRSPRPRPRPRARRRRGRGRRGCRRVWSAPRSAARARAARRRAAGGRRSATARACASPAAEVERRSRRGSPSLSLSLAAPPGAARRARAARARLRSRRSRRLWPASSPRLGRVAHLRDHALERRVAHDRRRARESGSSAGRGRGAPAARAPSPSRTHVMADEDVRVAAARARSGSAGRAPRSRRRCAGSREGVAREVTQLMGKVVYERSTVSRSTWERKNARFSSSSSCGLTRIRAGPARAWRRGSCSCRAAAAASAARACRRGAARARAASRRCRVSLGLAAVARATLRSLVHGGADAWRAQALKRCLAFALCSRRSRRDLLRRGLAARASKRGGACSSAFFAQEGAAPRRRLGPGRETARARA